MSTTEKELILEVLEPYVINGKVSKKKLEEVLNDLTDEKIIELK